MDFMHGIALYCHVLQRQTLVDNAPPAARDPDFGPTGLTFSGLKDLFRLWSGRR